MKKFLTWKFLKWVATRQIVDVMLLALAVTGFFMGANSESNGMTTGMCLIFVGYIIRSVTGKYEVIYEMEKYGKA